MLAFVLIASGCGAPYGTDYTRGRPAESDLPGVYVLTPATLSMVRGRMGYPVVDTRLVLRSDRTFEMENMPDCWAGFSGKPGGLFDNGKGTWSIRERKAGGKASWWEIDLNFENSLGISSVKPWDYTITERDGTVRVIDGRTQRYGHSANLMNQAPPYVIRFTVGDPDSGVGLEFEKKP